MSSQESDGDLEVIALWRLPDNFFQLDLDAQFEAVKRATTKVTCKQSSRAACKMAFVDEALAVGYLFLVLGFIWTFGIIVVSNLIIGMYFGSPYRWWGVVLFALLSLHPIPNTSLIGRSSRLSLALARYFTFEVLVDRNNPDLKHLGTKEVLSAAFQESHLPCVYLACPHGVFNFGAIVWCCLSRWLCGWYQYTGAATVVKFVPGLRFLDTLVWVRNADRKTIKRTLQERPNKDSGEAVKHAGGMMGMVPDGIVGAFRSKKGVDELHIGKKRGLLRICLEEGATLYGSWFFGTNDMLTVVVDPWGIMEKMSRKFQTGIMAYYGRWYLPIPYRVPVTLVVHPVRTKKTASPTDEEVEKLHQDLYGGLVKVYERQKHYVGYPDRTLAIK